MKFLITVLFCLLHLLIQAQERNGMFTTQRVEKQVKEFPDTKNLTSPLNAYLTFNYLLAKGERSQLHCVSSYRIKPLVGKNQKDTGLLDTTILNRTIKEVIIYRDSVAAVISSFVDSLYIFQYFNFEDKEWLSVGEGAEIGFLATQQKVYENLPNNLIALRQINKIKAFPTDTISFINYLKLNGENPEYFILDALSNNELVVYGELHRRKVSWDLLRAVINNPEFIKNTGVVFLELSSDKQEVLDQFYKKDTMEPEKILTVFRDMQINGWYDWGMYEFLKDLWTLNKKTPKNEQIKVIAADIPMPFKSIKTKEDYTAFINNAKDRNIQMADIVEQAIKTDEDKRNSLFIVGIGHAYKSYIPGLASGKPKKRSAYSAARLVQDRLSDKRVFTLFSHIPIVANDGSVHGKLRGGIYDYAFAAVGNKPIAFNLHNSPFGKEVFDAMPEIRYDENICNYEDNYDGYVFLKPLNEEEGDYILYELFSDEFVNELKRRAHLAGLENERWYGVMPKDLTKENIISFLKTTSDKRWPQ